jgi:gamma-glutamylcyclotransferase (GGCT)/AIG2-like uncharacterized protein YtfP
MGFCLFVYGTLQPGYAPYEQFCAPYVSQAMEAVVRGALYQLPLGYPSMVPGEGWVKGHWLRLDHDEAWMGLDQYESHDEEDFAAHYPRLKMSEMEYGRWRTDVYDGAAQLLGQAWVYGMNRSQVEALNGVWIESGDWGDYLRTMASMKD